MAFPFADFIKLVKSRPELYDEKLYKKFGLCKRKNAWREISLELFGKHDEKTVQFLKSKWKFTRDSFMRSYKLFRYRTAKGKECKEPVHMDKMDFLIPYLKIVKLVRPRERLRQDETDESEDNKEPSRPPSQTQEPFLNSTTVNQVPNVEIKTEEMDEIDQLFLSLARTVKKFKPLNRALVKKTITTAIIDMEIQEATSLEYETMVEQQDHDVKDFFNGE